MDKWLEQNDAPTKQHEGEAALPGCRVVEQCGACQLLAIPYEQQLADKQRRIIELFDSLGGGQALIHGIIGMACPYHYRNKVTSPFAFGKRRTSQPPHGGGGKSGKGKRTPAFQHEILCGMYAANSHRIIPTESCLIENEKAKRIILAIRGLMPKFRLAPYNEDAGSGFLRHAVVRVGHAKEEVLVTLVTNDRQFPRSKDFCRALVKQCPEITTIVQNVNTRQTNVILGESETTLYGPGFILDRLCGLSFRISSSSFYQVNPEQTETLYRRAIEMAQLTGSETVIDAYCGTGTIGLVAARGFAAGKCAAQVLGVDKVASAIRDARTNAKHNGIKNARFIVGDAGEFMRGLAAGSSIDDEQSPPVESTTHAASSIDVVLMDPPRAGASDAFLESLLTLAPKRIVYISCNPKTQARDVAFLVGQGYQLEEVQPVDMFPHTDHVECVALMSRAEQ